MNLFEIQEIISKFAQEKGINSSVDVRIIDLASEVRELSKEVLKGTDYGKKKFSKTEEWDNEIGDVLFSLICIANESGTNLTNCLKTVLEKYEKRFVEKRDLSSGR